MQMTVLDVKQAIEGKPDDLPVFFRRVAPICGGIEEAGSLEKSIYAAFGKEYPCLIMEPVEDEKGND